METAPEKINQSYTTVRHTYTYISTVITGDGLLLSKFLHDFFEVLVKARLLAVVGQKGLNIVFVDPILNIVVLSDLLLLGVVLGVVPVPLWHSRLLPDLVLQLLRLLFIQSDASQRGRLKFREFADLELGLLVIRLVVLNHLQLSVTFNFELLQIYLIYSS